MRSNRKLSLEKPAWSLTQMDDGTKTSSDCMTLSQSSPMFGDFFSPAIRFQAGIKRAATLLSVEWKSLISLWVIVDGGQLYRTSDLFTRPSRRLPQSTNTKHVCRSSPRGATLYHNGEVHVIFSKNKIQLWGTVQPEGQNTTQRSLFNVDRIEWLQQKNIFCRFGFHSYCWLLLTWQEQLFCAFGKVRSFLLLQLILRSHWWTEELFVWS